MVQVNETKDYVDWFRKQNIKEQAQIQARIARIKIEGHFGTVRKLGKSLAELKWRNGRRIYFAVIQDSAGNIILLLIGGNKNNQSRDIKKAKSIIRKLIKGF